MRASSTFGSSLVCAISTWLLLDPGTQCIDDCGRLVFTRDVEFGLLAVASVTLLVASKAKLNLAHLFFSSIVFSVFVENGSPGAFG